MSSIVTRLEAEPHSIEFEYVKLKSVVGAELDITNLILQIDLYESLYTPFMSGLILINDSLSLISTVPIVGEEEINIKFKIPHQYFLNDPIEFTGWITSVKNYDRSSPRGGVYALEFYSTEKLYDTANRVSKGYINKKISDIAKDVYDNYLKLPETPKEFTIESTMGERTIVIPNMRPSAALRFLANEAQADRTQTNTTQTDLAETSAKRTSNYIFYQDLKRFHFKQIDSLIHDGWRKATTSQQIELFTMMDTNLLLDFNPSQFVIDIFKTTPIKFSKIINMKIVKFFDKLEEIENGKHAAKLITIDPSKQTYRVKTKTYDEFFSEGFEKINNPKNATAEGNQGTATSSGYKTISDNSIFKKLWKKEENKGDGHIRFIIAQEDHNDNIQPSQRPDFLMDMLMSVAGLSSVVVNITIPGNTKIRPGDMISMIMPELGGTDDIISETNKFLSGDKIGFWFVTHVRHVYVKGQGYTTALELVKNVYEVKIDS